MPFEDADDNENPVRYLRKQHGLSRDQLAQRANVARGTVARLERGDNVHPRSAWLVARHLGVPVEALRDMKTARFYFGRLTELRMQEEAHEWARQQGAAAAPPPPAGYQSGVVSPPPAVTPPPPPPAPEPPRPADASALLETLPSQPLVQLAPLAAEQIRQWLTTAPEPPHDEREALASLIAMWATNVAATADDPQTAFDALVAAAHRAAGL